MAKALRLNERIRVSPVRVIDQEQCQLGILSITDAMNLARTAGLDLVEVSPMETPPVCRIMNYGRFKYERKKRQKHASGGHVIVLKEIRLRPKTGDHDRFIKMKRAKGFLTSGFKVQFTMLFRGRERFHKERAVEIFDHILSELGDTVKVERRPMMEGRRMTMVVAPAKHASQPAPVVAPAKHASQPAPVVAPAKHASQPAPARAEQPSG